MMILYMWLVMFGLVFWACKICWGPWLFPQLMAFKVLLSSIPTLENNTLKGKKLFKFWTCIFHSQTVLYLIQWIVSRTNLIWELFFLIKIGSDGVILWQDECKRVSTEGQHLRLDLSTKFQDAIKVWLAFFTQLRLSIEL